MMLIKLKKSMYNHVNIDLHPRARYWMAYASNFAMNLLKVSTHLNANLVNILTQTQSQRENVRNLLIFLRTS